MTTPALATGRIRVLGFEPAEISALTHRRVVDTHVTEAAFLWMQRERASTAPRMRLYHLERLDRRLDGHLQGLHVAATEGWAATLARLDSCDTGMVFVVAYLAFAGQDADAMRRALQLGLSQPEFKAPLVAALGWLSPRQAEAPLSRLAQSPVAAHRLIALSAQLLRRRVSDATIEAAAAQDDAALRAVALRAIGDFKRYELQRVLQQSEHDPDVHCRFWAAHSLALLGQADAVASAWIAAQGERRLSTPAIQLAMRWGEHAWAHETVRALAGDPRSRREALQAAGALGDPHAVPWLIKHFDQPRLARVAGESFCMITGAQLDDLGLERDAPLADEPPSPDDDPLLLEAEQDEDTDLRWPDQAASAAWWAVEGHRFPKGVRHLAGRPVSAAAVQAVLREGSQRHRQAAALEWARLQDDAPVFPTGAHGVWQCERLAA
ncbi:MAG: hypothetical protein RLZZ618_1399 [Pseudomonadota bacterium]